MTTSQRWTLFLTAGAALLVGLDALVVSTALSMIRTELGASLEQLEWTVNAYVLSFAVLMMTAAALGDRFGRKRLFAAGLALFAAASAACALVPDAGSLIAARALQGAGAALIMPLALALLAMPSRRRQGRGRSGSLPGSSGSRCPWGRCSGAPWSRASRGRGSSGSTCRSRLSLPRSRSPACARASALRPPSTSRDSRS